VKGIFWNVVIENSCHYARTPRSTNGCYATRTEDCWETNYFRVE
jgi:hypothetical protein